MSTNFKKLVIAIDGHSSTGKSTVAKDLAKQLGYVYVDTGAMYRSVTLYCLRNNLIQNSTVEVEQLLSKLDDLKITFEFNSVEKKNVTFLNGENIESEIRQLEVSNHVSYVASVKEVREHMVALQQDMGIEGGVVMDGRDIGTVVFPDADLKIFMTADAKIRAQRRFDELSEQGSDVTFEAIEKNVRERDYIDENRAESPLVKADDAIVLDNGTMTKEGQMQWILDRVAEIKK